MIGAALLVLLGLIAWSVAGAHGPAQPNVVVQASPGVAQPTNPPSARRGAARSGSGAPSPAVAAAKPTVVVPPTPTPAADRYADPGANATPTPVPARSAKIVNTDGQGAIMRKEPSVSAPRVKVVPEGTSSS